MKIIKKLVENVNLKEADELEDEEEVYLDDELDDEDLEINPEEDSIDEIADEVVNQVEVGSEGELTLSPEKANELATEIKKTGDEVGAGSAVVLADDDTLHTDNKITRILEKAFKNSIKYKRRGNKANNNVLITGLPGSGKTASVYDWANSHGEDVNLVYINAKNNDLDAWINGYTVRSAENPNRVGQAYSSNLDELEKKNSILFLDEYNRQTKPQIRAALYTLINEHAIAGEDEHKLHVFKNLLFTIACINPSVPTDKGAAPLNDAELSRFVHKIKDAHSDPLAAYDYFSRQFKKDVAKLDPKDPHYFEDLEEYLRMNYLALFLVNHNDFKFDSPNDLQSLSDNQATMFNQRALTEGLYSSGGDVEEFKEWLVENSDFLPKTIRMLLEILEDYTNPTLEELLTAAQADGFKLDGSALAATAPVEEEEITSTAEDDEDFFAKGSSDVDILSPAEVEAKINDIINSYL